MGNISHSSDVFIALFPKYNCINSRVFSLSKDVIIFYKDRLTLLEQLYFHTLYKLDDSLSSTRPLLCHAHLSSNIQIYIHLRHTPYLSPTMVASRLFYLYNSSSVRLCMFVFQVFYFLYLNYKSRVFLYCRMSILFYIDSKRHCLR